MQSSQVADERRLGPYSIPSLKWLTHEEAGEGLDAGASAPDRNDEVARRSLQILQVERLSKPRFITLGFAFHRRVCL